MHSFTSLRTAFPGLYRAVKEAHAASPHAHQGHGLDHDVAVALTAARLAGEDGHLVEKAFAAGLMHSTDRLAGDATDAALDRYLSLLPPRFTPEDASEIKEAVLRHMEYKDHNLATRKPTQKLLMDADKLVNMNPLIVIRAGQFRSNIPAIEVEFVGTRNPVSTYRRPTSVIEDLYGAIEWIEPGWFHYPAAEEKARALGMKLQQYIRDCESLYTELGVAGAVL